MTVLNAAELNAAELNATELNAIGLLDELSVDRMARELGATCGADPATVLAVVRGALRELRGSVSTGSLPEMATRLAAVRLLAHVPAPAAEPGLSAR